MNATESMPLKHGTPGGRRRSRWLGAVLVTLATVAVALAWRGAGGPDRVDADGLRRLPPAERFDTLFARAMQASVTGAEVGPLAAAALATFPRIEDPDDDRRFHAAMLALYLRDDSTASKLAEALLASRPRHLLGLMVRVRVAERAQDRGAADAAVAALLAGHRDELALPLPEYRDHREAIEAFLNALGRS